MKLWILDYLNPYTGEVDCIVIEAESFDEAHDKSINELKSLEIPKRYILKLEEF